MIVTDNKVLGKVQRLKYMVILHDFYSPESMFLCIVVVYKQVSSNRIVSIFAKNIYENLDSVSLVDRVTYLRREDRVKEDHSLIIHYNKDFSVDSLYAQMFSDKDNELISLYIENYSAVKKGYKGNNVPDNLSIGNGVIIDETAANVKYKFDRDGISLEQYALCYALYYASNDKSGLLYVSLKDI